MITLYGYPKTRSLRVSWLLEELGVEWQYHLVDLKQGEHFRAPFSQLNPRKKIPTLTDGSLTLSESAAICLYLAERYGQEQWLPQPGTDASGKHHQWISLITCELEQPLWLMGKHKFALPPARRVPEVLECAHWEWQKILEEVDPELPESGFLLGDHPMVADLLLAHTLNWAKNFEQPLSERAEAYRARICQRPALKRALKKELAGLPETTIGS
ncbi:glutathione S-transferase family protein [Ferrimonas gelatinilytica]|uniref:Glutathione S-transferase family protein n=1 Tax=Ferrimonas gelatinilytica TaxID=1255257 RepID=A0ABP9S1R5_9GAMM